jgi:hypothetical protein
VFWGPYVRHHYEHPNLPIKIPDDEIKERLKFPRSLPLKVQDMSRAKVKLSKKKKKSRKPKIERNLKFKHNLEHTLQSMRDQNKENGMEMKSGEEFEETKRKRKGEKSKMHYDKTSSYERGRKGGYNRKFGDDRKKKKKSHQAESHSHDDDKNGDVKDIKKHKKTHQEYENLNEGLNVENSAAKNENLKIEKDDNKSENLKVEANLNDDKHEDLHIKKSNNKGSKNMAYHNIFMKDEYKKDHTIFGEN